MLLKNSTIVCLLFAIFEGITVVKCLSGQGSYVMNLDSRFEIMRGDDPYLVMFYAPWCGHCKKLEPIYERVGGKLDGTGIYVAKLDATLYRDIASNYDVAGFPTLLYIHKDKVVDYHGDRTAEDISRFAIRCRSPPIQPIYSIGGLRDRLRQGPDEAFFVYIGDKDQYLFAEYSGAASNYSIYVDFFHAERAAMSKEIDETAKLPMVLVYKDGRRYEFNPMTDSSLRHWAHEEMFTAIHSAKGYALYLLMKMDKMLVFIIAQQSSADPQVKADSQRAIDGAKSSALDRNLKQFQFVVMDKVTTVANLLMDVIPVPYAVVFHPLTHLYYETEKPVQDMNSQDWVDFLSGIITGKLQAEGGQGFLMQLKRALYGLRSSVLELWNESRLLFGVVVVLPTFVISLVVYMICCATWAEEDGEPEDSDGEGGEDEEEEELVDGSTQVDEDTGHFKTE